MNTDANTNEPQRWPYAVAGGRFDDDSERRAEKAREARNEQREAAAHSAVADLFDGGQLADMVREFHNAEFIGALKAGDWAKVGKRMCAEYLEWIQAGVDDAADAAEEADDHYRQSWGAP